MIYDLKFNKNYIFTGLYNFLKEKENNEYSIKIDNINIYLKNINGSKRDNFIKTYLLIEFGGHSFIFDSSSYLKWENIREKIKLVNVSIEDGNKILDNTVGITYNKLINFFEKIELENNLKNDLNSKQITKKIKI